MKSEFVQRNQQLPLFYISLPPLSRKEQLISLATPNFVFVLLCRRRNWFSDHKNNRTTGMIFRFTYLHRESEPAVDVGKRKSLNASLKQWHFFSEWTKTSSSFLFCWGNLFWTKFWTLFNEIAAATISRMYYFSENRFVFL